MLRLIASVGSAASLLLPLAAQQPTFRVYNAATSLTTKVAENGVAPGSLISVDISALADFWQLDDGSVITLSLGSPGSAEMRVLYRDKPDYPFLAVLPPDTAIGPADLTVSSPDGKSSTARIYITASNFGLFANASQEISADGSPVANRLTNSAQPGQIVTLWGTGLGNADPASVVVRVADVAAKPDFAGHAPGQPGLDQINFRIPDDPAIPDDCYVPVFVEAAGRVNNAAIIAINRGSGACRHPFGLSQSQLAALDRGDWIWVAEGHVESSAVPTRDGSFLRNDYTDLVFSREGATRVAAQAGPYRSASQQNTCSVGEASLRITESYTPSFDVGAVVEQDPTGRNIRLVGVGPGDYLFYYSDPNVRYNLDQIPPSPLSPGNWSISTSGGADLDPWRFDFSTPPALLWTNRSQIERVRRGEDLILEWKPEGYGPSDRVSMVAQVVAPVPGSDEVRFVAVLCDGPAASGRINVSGALLSMLPASGQSASVSLTLRIGRARDFQLLFSVLSHGETIPGRISYSFADTIMAPIE